MHIRSLINIFIKEKITMDNNQYNPNNYQYDPAQNNYYVPMEEPSKGEGIKAMVFGIVSIYLGWFTLLCPAGIIFAVFAKKWSLPIVENYPQSSAARFAKIGKLTGTIGFWVSIGMTIFEVLFILFYIAYIVFFGMLLNGAL